MARPGDFSQSFDQVPRISGEAFLGQITEDSQLRRYSSGINQAPQAVEVWTVQVTSDPGDNVAGVLTFDFGNGPFDLAINTLTGPGVNEIATNIAAQAGAEPIVYGRVIPSVATDVVTFTGRTAGDTFVVTEANAWTGTPVQTQAAAVAADIPVARGVIRSGPNNTNAPLSPVGGGSWPEDLVALAAATLFTPQVQTLTVDAGSAVDMSVQVWEVLGNGEKLEIVNETVTGNATAATQATTIRNAINTAARANSVIASGTGADIIVTAELPGLEFEVRVSEVGVSKVNTTGPDRSTSLVRSFAGVATYTLSDEAAAIGGTEARYPANHGVRYLQEGTIAVESSEVLPQGGQVYIDLGTTDTGKFFASRTPGDDRIALARGVATWERRTVDGQALGVLNLTYQGR